MYVLTEVTPQAIDTALISSLYTANKDVQDVYAGYTYETDDARLSEIVWKFTNADEVSKKVMSLTTDSDDTVLGLFEGAPHNGTFHATFMLTGVSILDLADAIHTYLTNLGMGEWKVLLRPGTDHYAQIKAGLGRSDLFAVSTEDTWVDNSELNRGTFSFITLNIL